MTLLIIAEKFRGPPTSGNGGYVSGVFAKLVSHADAVEVTLRAPIPLDREMTADTGDALIARVVDGETLIAEIRPAEISLTIPALPDWQAVKAAEPNSYSLVDDFQPLLPGKRGFHPICFCCGADHDEGLKVFAAPIGDEQVAAVWQTKTEWGDDEGRVKAEYLWTAMDCPGQFAFLQSGIRTGLLGRMTARIHQRPMAGEPLLVTAWTIRVEGKKHFAGSAIHNQNGELCGEAITLWIGRWETPNE
jgi:hypothetical protein